MDRKDFISNILSLLEKDGELYEVVPSFTLWTAIGKSSVVGNSPGWSVSEMAAILAEQPEGTLPFLGATTQEQFLKACLAGQMDNYVNWDTWSASFDSEAFATLLTMASQLSAEYITLDDETVATGEALLSDVNINDFIWSQQNSIIFKDDVTYIGYPTITGEGSGTSMKYSISLGMTTTCSSPNAAWAFLRILWIDYQEDDAIYGFPITHSNLKAQIETESGIANNQCGLDEYGFPTQEYVDSINALIDSVDTICRENYALFGIILDEAGACFAGVKTAEETATMIQNRVYLYLNERL